VDATLSIKAYLYRIARNRAYNYCRDRRIHEMKHAEIRMNGQHPTEEADGPDAELDAVLLGRSLGGWLEELPERQREALRLSRFGGLSHDEVAAVMDISPRTVNNHIVRALATLGDRLRDYQADIES
jgi:RNA polymerase sigma factor (sigma-70 family)